MDSGSGAPVTMCESCGASEPAEVLAAVHRVYLHTDDEGRVTGETVVDEVEQWCLSCRSLYPHEAVGSGGS